MKRLMILVMAFILAAVGAPVEPLSYGDAVDNQKQYEYMLQYKLFGEDYLKIGKNDNITDKSGWNGSANYISIKDEVTLGGPILAGTTISAGNGLKSLTGPIIAKSFTMGNDNGSYLSGTMCLEDVNVSSTVETIVKRSEGVIVDACPLEADPPVDLSIPTISWPDTITQSIIIQDREKKIIDIPDTDYYDIYLSKITTGTEDTLFVRMKDGGTITRFFVKDGITLGNHTVIKVMYRTADGDSILSQDRYRGNLLFYTTSDFTLKNSDNKQGALQGTFISTAKISLISNINFAGQLIAKELEIGDDFDGKNFRFVKFDPDTIDVRLDKYGGLRENDTTVIIPIELSDTTNINVFFNYCFDLKDGVTVADFNIPPEIPLCNNGESKEAVIAIGSKVPSEQIKINVKKDTIIENEYLTMRIDSISGAILPNGKTAGELRIKIIDADFSKKLGFDSTAVYTFPENKLGIVDTLKIVNFTDSVRFHLDSAYTDRYKLDSVTGVLELVKYPLDFEKKQLDYIAVSLTDTNGLVVYDTLKIHVIDENEKPIVNDQNFKFYENTKPGSTVGIIKWEDLDNFDDFRNNVILPVDLPEEFKLLSSGAVQVTKWLDFEKDPHEFTFRVIVKDGLEDALADTASITISLLNLNEAPVSKDTTFKFPENKIGTVGQIVASDPEGKDLTYSIEEDVPFKIDADGKITNTKEFDYEDTTSYTFTVDVSDDSYITPVTVTVQITNVNELVHANDTTFTVPEYKKGDIGKVTAWDEDKTPVQFSVSDTAKYSIDKTGNLFLKEPYDYTKTKADTVEVIATDGTFSDTAKVIVKVTNVNDPPALQPNDTLAVPENCKNCQVGVIVAADKDGDHIKYSVIEKGFTIDSAGVLKVTEPLDFEKTKKVLITVTATDPSGAADTATYVVKVTDLNEKAWVKDTTFTVPENDTTSWKVTGGDEDGDHLKYSISDSLTYGITDDGVITLKKPFDYEKKNKDTVTVYVDDGRGSRDSAKIVIDVKDVPENLKITDIDDKPRQDTIRTNKPDHRLDYRECEELSCKYGEQPVETYHDTTVTICTVKGTSCDSVFILFNDKPPVVTLSKPDNTTDYIDYITIEEEKDDKIYINKAVNELTVTVTDTVHHTKETFPVTVNLDTVKNVAKEIKDYDYVINEKLAKFTDIGGGLIEMTEEINGVKVTVYLDAKTNKRKDTTQTISYTKKIGGKEVTISYITDDFGQRVSNYFVSYKTDDATTVTYALDDKKKIIKNKDNNIAYEIKYEYLDAFGNKASAQIDVVFDNIPPVVEILKPTKDETVNRNSVAVKWTVNGEVQDTLTLQRLEHGLNKVIRRYVDKAGNAAADTVFVFMKEAKDIDIELINPVTRIDQDKVDEYYKDHKYDRKNPATVQTVGENDTIPEPIGIGFKVDIRLPSASPTGGLATLDDIVKNGQIPVDDNGNVVGASTITIPVSQYVDEHCTDDFKKDYKKNGLNVPLYDVTYSLHLWVYTTTANFVNDFKVDYKLNDETNVTSAGTVQMVIDWMSDTDGHVKAKNGHALGTGSYITKLFSTSDARHRCDFQNTKKGKRTVRKDESTKVFGYKRPNK